MNMPTHRDSISGRTRTWPYGMQKRVIVIEQQGPSILIVADGTEGFVLIDSIPAGILPGDVGSITFTEGGPLGGYWKFEKDVEGGL